MSLGLGLGCLRSSEVVDSLVEWERKARERDAGSYKSTRGCSERLVAVSKKCLDGEGRGEENNTGKRGLEEENQLKKVMTWKNNHHFLTQIPFASVENTVKSYFDHAKVVTWKCESVFFASNNHTLLSISLVFPFHCIDVLLLSSPLIDHPNTGASYNNYLFK